MKTQTWKEYLSPRPKSIIQAGNSRSILPLAPPCQLHIPTPVNLLTSTVNTTAHTPMSTGTRYSPILLLRGIDRVRLPSHVGSSLRGAEGRSQGEGVVVKESVLEEELGLEEEGGQEKKRNEDALSPDTRKTTDPRARGHEFEPSAKVDSLRQPCWAERASISSSSSSTCLERCSSSDHLIECPFSLVNFLL